METTTYRKETGRSSDDISGAEQQTDSYFAGQERNEPENAELEWAKRHIRNTPATRPVELSTGLSDTGMTAWKTVRVADSYRALPPGVRVGFGDLAYLVIARTDRIVTRQNKKIDRLSKRLKELEVRGRLQ